MEMLERVRAGFVTTLGAAQPIETRRQFADLIIGGLLVMLTIGGLAI